MPLSFYYIMLAVSVIGIVAGAVSVFAYRQTTFGAIGSLILCILMTFFWAIKIRDYDEEKERTLSPITVKTVDKPQIDTIVTNRTDTLFIYHFNTPLK